MRETEKTVEIQGRTWKIRAFDALTGSYIAFQLFQRMMPGGLDAQALGGATLPDNRPVMSKEEFGALQKDCLSVVYEALKGRHAPVLNPNGSWGVEGLDHNTMLVLTLTIHAIAFNVADFFGDGGLKELAGSLSFLTPSNTET